MKSLFLITIFLAFHNLTNVKLDKNLKRAETQSNWSQFRKYIGAYSKETDFFRNPIVKKELHRILGNDFKSYQQHVKLSGCGEIEYKYGLIYGDVSQLHVGGYDSMFFIDTKEKKMYLYWLQGRVIGKEYKIYGDKPIPASVLNIVVEEENIGWGHVAKFSIDKNNTIQIEEKITP